MRRGSVMVGLLAGANRDPQVFPEPEKFDVTRENARDHVSFSAGRHYCLGAALARMEGEVGLRTLFERYPDLRVERGAVRRSTRILRGYEQLPVTLSPKPDESAEQGRDLRRGVERLELGPQDPLQVAGLPQRVDGARGDPHQVGDDVLAAEVELVEQLGRGVAAEPVEEGIDDHLAEARRRVRWRRW